MLTCLVTITDESMKNCYNIHWKDTNLSHEDINTVLLVDYVYEGKKDIINMSDICILIITKRVEMKLRNEKDWLVTMDYMMKL